MNGQLKAEPQQAAHGAAYNALHEEETKESVIGLYLRSLAENRKLREHLGAAEQRAQQAEHQIERKEQLCKSADRDSGGVAWVFLVDIKGSSGLSYLWSGFGNCEWSGHSYEGAGSLENIRDVIQEYRRGGTNMGLSQVAVGLTDGKLLLAAPVDSYTEVARYIKAVLGSLSGALNASGDT